MKWIKWKILIVTCVVCLLPILLGIALWDQLPDRMAIHFNFYNQPDNFSGKGFAVFGLPCLMVLLQLVCCVIHDVNSHKYGERKKFEKAVKWLIPVMTILLQVVTFVYNMGWMVDIRRIVTAIVGTLFLVTGNYLPKFDTIKNYQIEKEKAKKINRFIGFETVILGLLAWVTIFLPPVFLMVWFVLFIPYTIIGVVYGIKVGRKS